MKKHSGFTLLEIMVAMAVVAILVAVGLPRMSVFFKGTHMVVNANDLEKSLHYARSEAIKNKPGVRRVSICRSNNADEAVPTCAVDTNDWSTGWFVFQEGSDEGNEIGTYTPADDGAVLKVNTGAKGNKVTIIASPANIDKFVSFTALGVPKLSNGRSQSGMFQICDPSGLVNPSGKVVARAVLLSASGKTRVTNSQAKIGVCP